MGCGRAFCAEMHKLVNIFALANCRSCVTPPRTQKSLFHLPRSKFHQDPEWEETSPSVKLELSDIRSMCFVKFCYFLKLGGEEMEKTLGSSTYIPHCVKNSRRMRWQQWLIVGQQTCETEIAPTAMYSDNSEQSTTWSETMQLKQRPKTFDFCSASWK